MRRTEIIGLLILCCGCGKAASPANQPLPASKQGAVEKPVKLPAPPVKTTQPLPVAPTHFTDIPAAITALKQAFTLPAGREREAVVKGCQTWLVQQPDKAVPALVTCVNDASGSIELRLAACLILSDCGTAAVEPLCLIAESSDSMHVRRRAIDRLARMKPVAPLAIVTFVKLLDAKEIEILVPTLNVLTKIGEPAAAAGNKLQQLRLNHAEEIVRTAAGDALKKVSPRRTFQD